MAFYRCTNCKSINPGELETCRMCGGELDRSVEAKGASVAMILLLIVVMGVLLTAVALLIR